MNLVRLLSLGGIGILMAACVGCFLKSSSSASRRVSSRLNELDLEGEAEAERQNAMRRYAGVSAAVAEDMQDALILTMRNILDGRVFVVEDLLTSDFYHSLLRAEKDQMFIPWIKFEPLECEVVNFIGSIEGLEDSTQIVEIVCKVRVNSLLASSGGNIRVTCHNGEGIHLAKARFIRPKGYKVTAGEGPRCDGYLLDMFTLIACGE